MNDSKQSGSNLEFDKIHDALEKSTTRNSRQLLSFVLIQLYLLITVAATTDLQLLLPDSKVLLPLLSVELPLFGFYIVAPALIVIFHFHYLLNLLQHARKLKAWNEAKSNQHNVLLPGFIFNFSILFMPITFNYRLLRFLQAAFIGVFPVLLLLFIQIWFADYHSVPMTTWHCALFAADVLILIYFYRINYPELLDESFDSFSLLFLIFIRSRKLFIKGGARPIAPNPIYFWLFTILQSLSFALLLVVVFLSFNFFEKRHFFIPYISTPWETLVEPPSDIIIHAYLIEKKNVDSAWLEYGQGIDLSGRKLQFADFSQADLRYADLSGANLNGANLDNAKINFADLSGAQLNGASLNGAELNGADLNDAQLNGADLYRAQLNEASLDNAQLNGASLDNAKLNGASLDNAQLNGASLDNAQLNGASLDNAQLNGASLNDAQLNGADLYRAQLNGASLFRAELNGVSLIDAQLNGASLGNARLKGAVVSQAQVIFDDSYGVEVRGASSFEFSHRNGLFFDIPPDTITIPNWDRLITALEGFISIPSLKENALERLRDAKLNSSYLNPEFRELKLDFAGFIYIRQELACKSAFIAKGLLHQRFSNDLFFTYDPLRIQVLENVLQHMAQYCPDTLAAIQPQLAEEITNLIDSIAQELK